MRSWKILLTMTLILLGNLAARAADDNKPTSHTKRTVEGWTVRVDDRLLQPENKEKLDRAIHFLEAKLVDIKIVVPEDKVKKLQTVTIVLDQTHGKLSSMQYHPGAGWLTSNGYSADLVKCVHLPRIDDLWLPSAIPTNNPGLFFMNWHMHTMISF